MKACALKILAATKLLPLLLALVLPAAAEAQDAYFTNADGSVYTYSTNADGSSTIDAYAGPPWVVTVPATINGHLVTSIGALAFAESSLNGITIGDNVTNIGYEAFFECVSLTNVTIPDSVTTIGEFAFEYCGSLNTVTIGSGVTNFGEKAFQGCSALTAVTIRNGVTDIGPYAFQNCSALPTVIIPASVTNYLSDSFFDCSSLRAAYFLGNAPPDDNSTFYFGDSTTVYYLPGTTGWGSTFGGAPTVKLTTPLQIGGGTLGVGADGFHFTIKGTKSQTVVVEASTNLKNWQPIQTNTLTGTSTNFSDPQWTNYPGRYYRLVLP